MSTPIHVIVPAAGAGRRMQSRTPKQYLPLAGEPVLSHTLRRLLTGVPMLRSLTVALSAGDETGEALLSELVPRYPACQFIKAPGGSERSDSVLNALEALQSVAKAHDWVLVHDAARPCVRQMDIADMMAVLNASDDFDGGLLAIPVSATLKRGDVSDCVVETVDRKQMWAAATPQVFRYQALREALRQAVAQQWIVTDEASAMEAQHACIKLVPCQPDNIKITWQGDLAMAEAIIASQYAVTTHE